MTEMGALSWNYLMVLISFSTNGAKPEVPCAAARTSTPAAGSTSSSPTRRDYPLRTDGCSYARPELLLERERDLLDRAHHAERSVRAGGNGDFGRIDFDWHQGGDGVLRYEKRNVLGFSMDFAEDVTKSNWGIESTWMKGIPFEDNDELDRLREATPTT